MPPALTDGCIRVSVEAVQLAEGPGAAVFGASCAGVVTEAAPDAAFRAGDHVAIAGPVAVASSVVVNGSAAARLPALLSFADGASVVHAARGFGLYTEALRIGGGRQRVIVSGDLAAWTVMGLWAAQQIEAEVLAVATSGSGISRWLEAVRVPVLDAGKASAVAEEIRRRTEGQGVDLVINSLGGDVLRGLLGVVRAGGVFMELSRGEQAVAAADAAQQFPTVRFMPAGMDASSEPSSLAEGVAAGIECAEALREFQRIFPLGKAESAWQCALSEGGALLEIGGWSHRLVGPDDEAVLITGGYGGLGLCVAKHLVGVGARRVVLCGRRGPTAETQTAIAKMAEAGATIVCERCDVGDEAQVVSPLLLFYQSSGVLVILLCVCFEFLGESRVAQRIFSFLLFHCFS